MSHHFAELRTKHIRLSLLLALVDGGGHSQNESILQEVLVEYGLAISRDRVRTELRWLEEQGLITIRDVSGYLVATLTVRGSDVASGMTTVDGVKRPSPRG